MRKATIIEIICYAFILLFLYTAISKLITYETSRGDLERSPFIGDFALPLSIILPFLEVIIPVLLFIPKYRSIGLFMAATLMALFTIYVGIMVFTLKSLPCSCGGLIKELTWKQHFFFNIFFTALGIIGVFLQRKIKKSAYMSEPSQMKYT